MNIDRLMAQEPGSYFAYLLGTTAGLFKLTVMRQVAMKTSPASRASGGSLSPGAS